MIEQEDDLQRLVRKRMEELGDSYRAAAARSHGLVSHATLSRIAAGSYRGKRIQGDTLAGVALALQVSEREVYAAAEAALRPEIWVTLSEGFARLDPELQQKAIETMRALYLEHEQREKKKSGDDRPFG